MLISQSFLKGTAAKWASPEEAHDARRVSVSRMKDQTSKSLYEQSYILFDLTKRIQSAINNFFQISMNAL